MLGWFELSQPYADFEQHWNGAGAGLWVGVRGRSGPTLSGAAPAGAESQRNNIGMGRGQGYGCECEGGATTLLQGSPGVIGVIAAGFGVIAAGSPRWQGRRRPRRAVASIIPVLL